MKQKVRIKVASSRVLPTWAVAHYLQQTESNYLRLVTTEEICEYTQRGYDLNRLVVATESAALFPTGRISLSSFKERIELAEKSESAERFWNIIGRHHRPMVFVADNDRRTYTPLYDYLKSEALVVRRLSVNSPFTASFEGLASALPDLLFAREREQRSRDEWKNQQIGQAARNISDIVSASDIINNTNAHPGVKAYATQMLDQLLDSQQRLNESAGVVVRKIDTNV